MDLIDEVHLVAPAGRCVLHIIEKLTGIVDLGARGRVDLDEIGESPGVYLLAGRTLPARVGPHPLLTVQSLGKETRHGGLADATDAAEKIGMVDTPFAQGKTQRADHGVLTQKLWECARTPFSRQHQITHEGPRSQ
jgi:hypothetical protein